jgi:hypothetical protein
VLDDSSTLLGYGDRSGGLRCTNRSDPLIKDRIGRGGRLGEFVKGVVLLRVDTLVLLEILGSLEGFATDRAWVGLEWRVN